MASRKTFKKKKRKNSNKLISVSTESEGDINLDLVVQELNHKENFTDSNDYWILEVGFLKVL